MFSESNTTPRKESHVDLEVRGKGPRGVCPLSCSDMNTALHLDRVWKNCSLGTNSGALQFKKLWPGHIPMCLHMHKNVETTVFQYTDKKEDGNNAPPCWSAHCLIEAEQEAVNIEL